LGLWVGAVLVGLLWERHPILQLPGYVPCFLAGVVAYRLEAAGPRPWLFVAWPLALATATGAYLLRPTLMTGWIACLALGLSFPRIADLPRGRLQQICRIVARYSYGIYLSHFILLWLAFVRLGHWPMGAQVAIFGALLAAVPAAAYHVVEEPFIRLGGRVADRCRLAAVRPSTVHFAVAGGAAVLAVVAIRRSAAGRPDAMSDTSLAVAPPPAGGIAAGSPPGVLRREEEDHEQHHDEQAQPAAGVVPPSARMRPRRHAPDGHQQ
jgi:hypothetical protein